MATSRLFHWNRHLLPVLALISGYVHTTLHWALALLHDMSSFPMVPKQVCCLHCLYYLYTFIILFQVKVTTVKLHWNVLELCFIARTWPQTFYTLGCGTIICWWVWSLQAAAHPLSLFHVRLSFYSICGDRRAAMGMILAVCWFDVKQQKTI